MGRPHKLQGCPECSTSGSPPHSLPGTCCPGSPSHWTRPPAAAMAHHARSHSASGLRVLGGAPRHTWSDKRAKKRDGVPGKGWGQPRGGHGGAGGVWGRPPKEPGPGSSGPASPRTPPRHFTATQHLSPWDSAHRSGKAHQATWRVTPVCPASRSAQRTWERRLGGQMCQGGKGRTAGLLSPTHRLAHPGHTEPLLVLPEGLEAGPTDVSAWGAPCPPLQGTVQAPRTGGHIWEGSRAGSQRQSQPPRPLPPAELARPGSGHCSGQALPHNRQGPGRQTVQRLIGTPLPRPLPRVHCAGLSQPSAGKLPLAVWQHPAAQGRAKQPPSLRSHCAPGQRASVQTGAQRAAKNARHPPPPTHHSCPPKLCHVVLQPWRAEPADTMEQVPGLEAVPSSLTSGLSPGHRGAAGIGETWDGTGQSHLLWTQKPS